MCNSAAVDMLFVDIVAGEMKHQTFPLSKSQQICLSISEEQVVLNNVKDRRSLPVLKILR